MGTRTPRAFACHSDLGPDPYRRCLPTVAEHVNRITITGVARIGRANLSTITNGQSRQDSFWAKFASQGVLRLVMIPAETHP